MLRLGRGVVYIEEMKCEIRQLFKKVDEPEAKRIRDGLRLLKNRELQRVGDQQLMRQRLGEMTFISISL